MTETQEWEADAPPQDVDAEMAVLGSMLISKDAVMDVVEVLQGADFYRPAHEAIYEAIVDLFSRGEPADAITVLAVLTEQGAANRVGGGPYLHTLAAGVPIAANATYYAEIVRKAAVRRRLIEHCTRGITLARSDEGDVEMIVDRVQAEVLAVTSDRTATDYVPLAQTIEPALDYIENIGSGADDNAVPTGIMDLDDLLDGLQPGQMIVLAGRPAMGKSTLAVDFLRSASIRHGMASAIFSLEMSKQDITLRIIAAEARVPLNKLKGGHMGEDDWGKVAGVVQQMGDAPLFIDDSPNLTMTEIRAKARRLKQRHDLRLIVVDYLQLMTSGKKVESRQMEVSEFSRQIKLLAKELGVPVVAVSQLNRGPEQRTNKRPMMSDLRESGSLEQDADIVILLHREDYYDLESTRLGEADIIVAKHRNGATKDVAVTFQGHFSRFVDMARV